MSKNVNEFNYQYEKLMDKLKEDLNKTEDDEEKVQIYITFLENYMMPKLLWTDLLQISDKQDPYYMIYDYNPIYHNLVKNGPYYFLYNQQGSANAGYQLKIYENFNGYYDNVDTSFILGIEELLIENGKKLLFPHQELHYIFIRYEKDRFSPISNEFRENVLKMKELFWKIKASENDPEKWFNLLKEVNNEEFLEQNVENQLLNNLSNNKLWKLYINYWKERNHEKMLHIYSNYCRYFLDDIEMKEEYKNEVEKYGPIFVKWKNRFDFENVGEAFPPLTSQDDFGTFVSTQESSPEKLPFECPIIDLSASMMLQEWSLPKPIIRYISLQTFPSTSETLLKTCKYFLQQNTALYCYKAAFVDKIHFGKYKITEKSFLISIPSLDSSPFKKNIYITDVLIFEVDHQTSFRDHSISLNLSKTIKNNIYKCDAKFIDIKNQKLNEKEFKFLVGHGNVKYLILNDIHIFKDGEEEMSLDEILELTPKLEYLSINVGNLRLSKNALSELKFTQKLIYFQISCFSNIINSSDYCNFLKKYAAPCSKFLIQFYRAVDENLYKIFEENVTEFVNEWEPAYQKPVLTFTRR